LPIVEGNLFVREVEVRITFEVSRLLIGFLFTHYDPHFLQPFAAHWPLWAFVGIVQRGSTAGCRGRLTAAPAASPAG